jgi:N-acetylneuraminic acid mutarotase
MNNITKVILLAAALLWLPADWLMTSAAAQANPAPAAEAASPNEIRQQKRAEAFQQRQARLAATRTAARGPENSGIEAPQGKWEPRAPLPPGARERAFHFVIGDKMYVGTGRSYRGWATGSTNEDDVWAYDFATDTWEERSPFPGGPIRNAASFVIDGIAYIATGHDGGAYLDIFWKYDPASDTWEELPPFPGGIRSFPVAFAIDGKGYVVGGGIGNDVPGSTFYHKDAWEYDPATQAWTQLADFPGQGRWRAFAFVIDGQAYVGGGNHESTNSSDFSDCYRFDPADGSWTPIADFPEGYGLGCYAVAIDGKAYVGEGGNHDYFEAYRTKLWEYDPGSDTWTHVSYTPAPKWAGF